MLLIGEANCNISISGLSEHELAGYAELLFDDIEQAAERFVRLPDYELHLDVEEGSILTKQRILVGIGTLYFGIGNYGSFIQGVREIKEQVKTVADVFLSSAPDRLSAPRELIIKKNKSSAKLGELDRLFESVANGEMTPRTATDQALKVLEDDEKPPENLRRDIEKSIAKIKKHPEQVPFAGEGYETPSGLIVQTQRVPPKKALLPPPAIAIPTTNKLRIEVWRESKSGKKNVRIVPL